QASILSGKYPNEHGIICNGLYNRNKHEVSFWEQANSLVETERIWDLIKKKRPYARTAVLFGQHTMYSNADFVVTPRPLHMADEMIMWCYSRPPGYYEELKSKFGEFNLASYWGPLASQESSAWIVKAALYTLEHQRPNFMFVYIPHADYSAQKFGKNSIAIQNDLKRADEFVGNIVQKVTDLGIENETLFIIFSEYSFNDVKSSVPLNQKLRDASLLATRNINGKEYLDLEYSNAFAMVDHQIAHIYVQKGFEDKAMKVLQNVEGVDTVLTSVEKTKLKIDHKERTGDIIAISDRDKWFNYNWWYDGERAPKFARTIDIHRKPGYDPLELCLDYTTKSISQDTSLIKGSHGLPPDAQKDEGLALYVSNRRTGMMENRQESRQSISSVKLGKYLIDLLAT
ncbi:MAG TPA: nucleotide pyrophosphatase/phosphodiesterase family protein, partial [Nitrososphaeraceae archaeon]|nr:nucleotide pyrophosphatase/phosphodiesterase family protein [Nitrososphaeraceae archaeon]